MTGSAFKRKDAVVRTYFHGGDIYLPVFLYLPCSRNKVGDDEFHGGVSVYFHIDFAGQGAAVSAEGNDPVGYLYAYHFLRINAFLRRASVYRCCLQPALRSGSSLRWQERQATLPHAMLPVRWHHRGGWAVRRSGSWFRIPEFFSFAAHLLYLCISGFGQ